MGRRQRKPTTRRGTAIIPAGRLTELRRRGAGGFDTWYAYSCEACGEGFSSTKRERVINWTLTHLRRHVAALTAALHRAKGGDQAEADAALLGSR